jgi:hypothetical protein
MGGVPTEAPSPFFLLLVLVVEHKVCVACVFSYKIYFYGKFNMCDFGPLKDYIELVGRGIEVRGYLTRKIVL